MFALTLLGGASLRGPGGHLVLGPAVQRHRLALLAYLAVRGARPVSRDQLLATLWPERDTGCGRRLLNLAVHAVRQAVGREAIHSVQDGLVLDPACVTSDVAQFETALERHDWSRAVAVYHGPFLEGFHLPASPPFDSWLDTTRTRLAARYAALLERHAREHEGEGDWRGAAEWWRRLADLDRGNGTVVRRLMLALEAMRDPARALEQARIHAEYAAALGAGPDPLVSALARALAAGHSTRSQDLAERAEVRPVAVLPFVGVGLTEEDQGLGEGLAFEVAHRLRTAGVRVADASRVRGEDYAAPEIGARLGVTRLVQGTARRIGARLRITATLIATATGIALWSGSFDRVSEDLFALQEEIGEMVAGEVEGRLGDDD